MEEKTGCADIGQGSQSIVQAEPECRHVDMKAMCICCCCELWRSLQSALFSLVSPGPRPMATFAALRVGSAMSPVKSSCDEML